jgi:hypothetical protein
MKKHEVLQEFFKGGVKIHREYWKKDCYLSYDIVTDTLIDQNGTKYDFSIFDIHKVWKLYKEPVKLEVNPLIKKIIIRKENHAEQSTIVHINSDGIIEIGNNHTYDDADELKESWYIEGEDF